MTNYIEINEFPFSSVTDKVQTEANAFNLVKNNDVSLKENLYVGVPLANIINKKGPIVAQDVLDKLEQKINQKKIYVCQHILVNKLNFYNNIVFTPHAEQHDRYKIIPHYNLYFEKNDVVKFENRKCLFSFFGAFNTHPYRTHLASLNSFTTPIVDTGIWHFEKNEIEQEKNKNLYKKLLTNSKFSLCPPGTGANTIRFYESLSVGSIPVIFNNIKVPKEIEESVVRYDINNLNNLPEYLINLNNAGDMCKQIYNFYWNNFDNNIIHKLIEKNV